MTLAKVYSIARKVGNQTLPNKTLSAPIKW